MERRCWAIFQCRGVLLIWIIVRQGPVALAVGAGWGCFDIFFSHLSFLSSFSLSLRYRLKYCLKGPLNPKQPTNQLSNNSNTTEANLTKLHRKMEHKEKVCRAQELGSYAQGQGHNQVKGQIVPKIELLINYRSKFDET